MDRRTDRTNRALIDAARSLMRTRAWHDVSVRRICDAADVSRSTFYAHHDGKQALLDVVFDALRTRLAERVHERGLEAHRSFAFLPVLVAHMKGHLPLVARNAASPSGLELFARFKAVVGDTMRDEIRLAGMARDVSPDRIAFMLGGTFGVLEKWCAAGCVEPEASVLEALDRQCAVVLEDSSRTATTPSSASPSGTR